MLHPGPTREPDALVIGAGVIGLAIARDLARRGLAVRVVTRDAPGAGASAASAGMLEMHHPFPMPASLAAFCRFSGGLYPEWVRELKAETGVDPGRDECGTIALARDAAELADLKAQAAAFPGTTLFSRPEEWLKLEPRLPASLAGALWLPGDHHLDPRRLCEALLVSLERAGVGIVRGVTVSGLLGSGSRVEGAMTDAGPMRAGTTVIAAGAWAGRVARADASAREDASARGDAGAAEYMPVRPRKGQLLVLEIPEPPRRVLLAGGIYLVPRPLDHRLLLGATMEDAGFDDVPTAGAVAHLLGGGVPVFPPIAQARFVEVRVGLRPGTPDDLPMIGRSRLEGLVWAAGHFRKGILLAPGTARLAGELVAGEAPSHPIEPFAPGRFGNAHPA